MVAIAIGREREFHFYMKGIYKKNYVKNEEIKKVIEE
jgi:hypothetical protein